MLWRCEKTANQEWHWGQPNAYGWRPLINGDNECLAIAGGSQKEGARVYGWRCKGTTDQYWSYGGDLFLDFNPPAWALSVAGRSTSQGAAVIMWGDGEGPGVPSPDQYWTIPPVL